MPLNESEVPWQIVHGKPYEGKLHVRFVEGSPETGWQVTTALVTYSTIVLADHLEMKARGIARAFLFAPPESPS